MKYYLICQECRGSGKIVDDKVEFWEIAYDCGYCNGTGLISPKNRGIWLTHKKLAKHRKKEEKKNAYL